MGLFKSGDNVTVVHDSYPEPGSQSRVGSTGQVTSADHHNITVRLDGDSSSTGFMAEELQRNS